MSLHVPLPGKGEEGQLGQPGRSLGGRAGLPRPSPLAFRKQRKMEAEAEPGKGAKGQGSQRQERSREWASSEGRRWLTIPRQRGGARLEIPGAEVPGEPEVGALPGGSQRKEKAPRSRYLCGGSERPRGSHVLQQFHLDLRGHRRRRCGRRLGHVALDHWRKVGSERSSQPRRRIPSSSPPPPGAPIGSGGRPGLRPGCSRRSAPQRPGTPRRAARRSVRGMGPGHRAKRAAQEAGRGGAAAVLGRGAPSAGQPGPGRAGAARRGSEPRAPGKVLARRGGSSGSASQGEVRRKARVTSRKVPRGRRAPRGLRFSCCASRWRTG